MHVLVETWHLTNNQIDWAEDTHPLAPEDIEGIRQIKEESGGALTVETLSFCRRFFYAFDYERLGTLSLSDVQRAVSYAFLQDEAVPTEDDVRRMFNAILSRRTERGGDRLRLAEFLRLLFSLRSQMQARQQSSAYVVSSRLSNHGQPPCSPHLAVFSVIHDRFNHTCPHRNQPTANTTGIQPRQQTIVHLSSFSHVRLSFRRSS